MTDLTWLANEAKNIHQMFYSIFYIAITLLLVVGVVMEFFKIPLGEMPSFSQLVVRVFLAAILLNAYPEIANAIANVTDAIASKLGDMNNFKLVLDRMGEKLGELSWSWVSIKDTAILIISFLTFFLLYFSIHIADAFYLYTWTLLYAFAPLLIALYVLPATSGATKALFKSLFEIASWKIVWSVLATLLWSSALSNINDSREQISFLTAISFNVILAGSLLLTPFVVHALAGTGLAGMTKNLGALAIGGLALSPGTVVAAGKAMSSKAVGGTTGSGNKFQGKNQGAPSKNRNSRYKSKRKIPAK